MPKGGSRFRTSRPKRTSDYYSSKKNSNDSKGGGNVSTEINPLENSEYFAAILECKKCKKGILVPETEESKMHPKEKRKQKCILCGGKYKLSGGGAGLLPGIVVPLVRIK